MIDTKEKIINDKSMMIVYSLLTLMLVEAIRPNVITFTLVFIAFCIPVVRFTQMILSLLKNFLKFGFLESFTHDKNIKPIHVKERLFIIASLGFFHFFFTFEETLSIMIAMGLCSIIVTFSMNVLQMKLK